MKVDPHTYQYNNTDIRVPKTLKACKPTTRYACLTRNRNEHNTQRQNGSIPRNANVKGWSKTEEEGKELKEDGDHGHWHEQAN